MRQAWVAGLLLLAVLIGVGWIIHLRRAAPGGSTPAPPPSTDYFVRGAEVEVTDERGRIMYRLQASEALHFPDDSVRLRDVQVRQLGGEQGAWQLQASRGYMPPDGRSVQLSEGVRITGMAADGPLTLTTPDARVDVRSERISTAASVSVEAPGYRANATGMEAGFRSRDLVLLHGVQSELYVR